MNINLSVKFAVLAALLAGCAPTSQFPDVDEALAAEEARRQMEEAGREFLETNRRLNAVAFQISKHNVELCGDNIKPLVGFVAQTLDAMPKDWRDTMRDKYGITNHLSVIGVNEDSPADEAGLKIGDKLISIGDRKLGEGKRAIKKFNSAIEDSGTDPIAITVLRNNVEVYVTVTPVTVCSYPVEMIADDSVNAFADGTRVVLTTGMIRFAESDEELALIVGHELAHNTRGHIDAKIGNRFIGATIGALLSAMTGVYVTDITADAGSNIFSQEFEAEADYVGVYHAARAGYDVHKAAEFWRKMARIHPNAIGLAGTTHPSTAKRFLAVQAAADEISRKREENMPLIPEER